MPNRNWSKLSTMQIGRYAEYYAKMEFASYGLEVYTSEVDDHGVDFVAKNPNSNRFYEVQVKAVRKMQQVFIPETKMPKDSLEFRLVCLLVFEDGKDPMFFVIPGTAWNTTNSAIAHYKYDKPGQKCEPEYALNVTQKNLALFDPYKAEIQLDLLK